MYKVTITEYRKRDVYVSAESSEDALNEVERRYANGDIVLDDSDFVDFKTEVKQC